LLTPVPPSRWGPREIALAGQFVVLPATVAAIEELVEARSVAGGFVPGARRFDRPDAPDLARPDFLPHLRHYLGNAIQWVCACAVYPDLQWDLTLSLAAVSETPNVLTEDNLLKLARLSWFRLGAIPDWARVILLEEIRPSVERNAREIVIRLLEANPAP